MARTEDEAVEKACKKYGVAKEKVKLTQGQFCIYVSHLCTACTICYSGTCL